MATPRPAARRRFSFSETPMMDSQLRCRIVTCGYWLLAASSVCAQGEPNSPVTKDAGAIAPEVKQIQRALGGPVVDRFSTLRANDAKPLSSTAAKQPNNEQRQAVEALRDAATQLDATANKLERLELYRQADALRQQAQQLRLDARGMTGAAQQPVPTPQPMLRPTEWGGEPAPSGDHVNRPEDQPNLPTPTPSLEPSPHPE
jgi:hypothetical protein